MKKMLQKICMGCFLLVAGLLMAPPVKSEAADLVQTAPSANSITVQWETPEGEIDKYHVYAGSSYSDLTEVGTLPATATSATIGGLAQGSVRCVQVKYDKWNYNKTDVYTYTVGSIWDAKTIPGQVKNVRQDRWYYYIKTFDATWDSIASADGYEYIVRTSSGKVKARGTMRAYSSTPQANVRKISNSMVYTVQVRAYSEICGRKYYGPWSQKGYFFTQPRVKSVQNSKGRLTVKWDKVSGATGYNVYVSTRKNKGYKKVKTVGNRTSSVSLSKVLGKKVSSSKRYYVYVSTLKRVGKKTYTSGKLYYWNSRDKSSGYF